MHLTAQLLAPSPPESLGMDSIRQAISIVHVSALLIKVPTASTLTFPLGLTHRVGYASGNLPCTSLGVLSSTSNRATAMDRVVDPVVAPDLLQKWVQALPERAPMALYIASTRAWLLYTVERLLPS